MQMVKEQFGKEGGIVAFHGYQAHGAALLRGFNDGQAMLPA